MSDESQRERIVIEDVQTGHFITVDRLPDGHVSFVEARDKTHKLVQTTPIQRSAMVDFAKDVISKR